MLSLIVFLESCPQGDTDADADCWQTKVNLYVSPRTHFSMLKVGRTSLVGNLRNMIELATE